MRGFASDWLGIRRCMGGPGGPQMLRGRKLKKWSSDPGWAQNGGFQNCTPKIGPLRGHLPMGPKWGCKKHPPCGPLRGQLPIVGFWAPEDEWDWGIGKGGSPAVCILGGGYGKAHRMYFWEGLSPKEGCTACIPGRAAKRLAAMLICWRVI